MDALRLDPELYRLLHRGTPGDVAFYKGVCAGAESVLELGCGWGRVLSALRGEGRKLTGLEAHPGLLAMARQELPFDIDLAEGDMASFSFDQAFDRILLPYNGLWCLESSRVASCLDAVRRHLKPGGLFAFDVWNADGFHDHADPEDLALPFEPLVTITRARGDDLDVLERADWDREKQRLDVAYVYIPREGRAGGEVREETITHWYLRRVELERLLREAGLETRAVTGDFRGEPWDADAEHLVVVAERPASRRLGGTGFGCEDAAEEDQPATQARSAEGGDDVDERLE